MAIAVGAVAGGQGSGTAARTMTYPTVNAGDVVVCIIEWGGNINLTVPTGFTAVPNLPARALGSNVWIGWRVGTGGGTSYTPAATSRDVWTILTFTGADTTTPVNISGSSARSVGSGVTAPSVTTTVDGCLILSVAANQITANGTTTTWTDPAGTNRQAALVSNLAGSTVRWQASDVVADPVRPAAGATTARAFAGTASGDVVATTVAFAPASALPPSTGSATLRPVSDVALGGWTLTGATEAWDALDDVTADDSTTRITSPVPATGTVSAECEVQLAPVLDPVRSDLHTIYVRVLGGGFAAYPGLRVRLYQGTTLIAGFSAGRPTVYTTASYTLTSAEADSITDYGDLRLRFAIDASIGSGNGYVTQAYLDVPAVLAAAVPLSGVLTAVGALPRVGGKRPTGEVATTGAVARGVAHAAAGAVSGTGNVQRAGLSRLLTASVSGAGALGALARRVRSVAGSVAASGSVLRGFPRTLTGALAASGTVGRAFAHLATGALSSSGVARKLVPRLFDAATSATGAVARTAQLRPAGGATATGALIGLAGRLRSMVGSATATGTAARATVKTPAGSVTGAATVARLTRALRNGTATAAGVIGPRAFAVKRAGTLTGSGSVLGLARRIRSYAGSLTGTGTASRRPGKSPAGSATPTGTIPPRTLQLRPAGLLGAIGDLLVVSFHRLFGRAGTATLTIRPSSEAELSPYLRHRAAITVSAVAEADATVRG